MFSSTKKQFVHFGWMETHERIIKYNAKGDVLFRANHSIMNQSIIDHL